MTVTINWINPGRLLRITISTAPNREDLMMTRKALRAALREVTERLDYLLDLSAIESAPGTELLLKVLLERNGALRSTKTGQLFVVSRANVPEIELIMQALARALHLKMYHFTDAEAALYSAAHSDA